MWWRSQKYEVESEPQICQRNGHSGVFRNRTYSYEGRDSSRVLSANKRASKRRASCSDSSVVQSFQASAAIPIRAPLSKADEEFERKWAENSKSTSNVKLSDFKVKRTIGTGSFGRVFLVKKKSDKTYYAMKVLRKSSVVGSTQVELILNEKRTLLCLDSPFLIKLHFHFMDNANLYMVLTYVAGGDMRTHLQRHLKFKKYFREEDTLFYSAQIVLALEYLHSHHILYRDLKPENVMVDQQGYIKLVDFGLAKRTRGRTSTMCGTSDYMAPEILMGKWYDKSVDFWALGVLIFEMTAGYSPYQSHRGSDAGQKIVTAKVCFPENFSPDMRHLLWNLLQVDQTKRYGSLQNGIDDIKNHPWFRSIDWMDIYFKKVEPPWKPIVSSPGDTRQFDICSEDPTLFKKKTPHADLYSEVFKDF